MNEQQEKDFDRMFPNYSNGEFETCYFGGTQCDTNAQEIKSFINKLLTQRDIETSERIAKLKLGKPKISKSNSLYARGAEDNEVYDSAIDDALAVISDKK